MDVLTMIKDSDPSFGFGTWRETEVVMEVTVLLDSWKLSLPAKSNVAVAPQVTLSGEITEKSWNKAVAIFCSKYSGEPYL